MNREQIVDRLSALRRSLEELCGEVGNEESLRQRIEPIVVALLNVEWWVRSEGKPVRLVSPVVIASGGHVQWRPIKTPNGSFLPKGPPVIIEADGSEHELTQSEAERRFPGIDFGFPLAQNDVDKYP